MKKYMIVEHFSAQNIRAIYERFDEKGRLLPEGVHYIDSWIDEKLERCFQLMESESAEKIQEWISHWQDLASFEIYPVMDSAVARFRVLGA